MKRTRVIQKDHRDLVTFTEAIVPRRAQSSLPSDAPDAFVFWEERPTKTEKPKAAAKLSRARRAKARSKPLKKKRT